MMHWAEKSRFSFWICRADKMDLTIQRKFQQQRLVGEYSFCTDKNTPLEYAGDQEREMMIFGYAADLSSGQSEDLPRTILTSVSCVDEVIGFEYKLGGKYVIFYREGSQYYLLGDATCSVPVFYTTEISDFICCSNLQWLVERKGLLKNAGLQAIRASGHLNQAMPFDITPYKEIKQLIPNHYVDFSSGQAIRFVNFRKRQKEISPEDAAEITAPLIERLAAYYLSKFKVYCPLTSGRDSRVVFAFLKSISDKGIKSYTVWQEKFHIDDQDWVTPAKLTALSNAPYEQIYNEEIAEEMREEMDSLLGAEGYPMDAFTLAVTLNKHYGDGAVIEGDIIGQVGKCSLHRDIPEFLATPGYFRCKLHNYSAEAKKYLAKWMSEIRESDEKVNCFDLFSIENRMGRWAAQTHLIHNTIGQLYLNIFNSRSIIYHWTFVRRGKRKKSLIHIALIKKKAPELLQVPFEQERNRIKAWARTNGLIFYCASYAKYFIERMRFFRDAH